MKIPTLLGLILLLIAIGLGITLFYVKQQAYIQGKIAYEPIDFQIANITDTSAVITWQTHLPIQGTVYLSNNTEYKDSRDELFSQPYTTHFVTLTGLAPQTQYTFTLRENGFEYSDGQYKFTTASQTSKTEKPASQILKGTVLTNTLNALDEGLVYLRVNNAITQATYVKKGNYLLPIQNIDEQSKQATLLIKKNNQQATINFTLPLKEYILPTVTLGQNIDLGQYYSSSSALPKGLSTIPLLAPKPASGSATPSFDINNDGRVNTPDLSIVLQNVGKNTRQADLNNDGTVDQKDVDLIRAALSR